jgi:hypothetical protein
MILLSFSGFLRYDEVSSLRLNDVKVHDNHLVLHLEKSKTDQYRQSKSTESLNILQSSINVSGEMGSFFSLGFTAMRLDASKTDDTKVFVVGSGSPVTIRLNLIFMLLNDGNNSFHYTVTVPYMHSQYKLHYT